MWSNLHNCGNFFFIVNTLMIANLHFPVNVTSTVAMSAVRCHCALEPEIDSVQIWQAMQKWQ